MVLMYVFAGRNRDSGIEKRLLDTERAGEDRMN